MRIRSVDFSASAVADLGLAPIKMDRLSKIVVIAGRNGSGKTRLLRMLERAAEARLAHSTPDTSIIESQLLITRHEQMKCEDSIQAESLKLEADRLEVTLALLQGINLGPTDQPGRELPIVNFVPTDLNLVTSSSQTISQIKDNAAQVKDGGVKHLAHATLSYIYRVQQMEFESSHPNNRHNSSGVGREIYARLKNLVVALLGEPLQRSPEGEPTLFGRSLSEHRLSKGQVVLLQLAVALHAQGRHLKSSIILLDEPENHLHSFALVEVVKHLSELLVDGQIWICTHSIPLVSHVAEIDPFALWNMEDGAITRAGKVPGLILKNLLGNSDEITKLANFLRLPHELARSKFCAQCLLPPEVAGDTPHDPQIAGIQAGISKIRRVGMPLRVLDYGAGKGRLLAGLVECHAGEITEFRALLDYVAFDIAEENVDECRLAIEAVYPFSGSRHFASISHVIEKGTTFDVVILSNVLHEISPKSWIDIFSAQLGPLTGTDGWVMIVEDQQMPVGEFAHEFGFLVLNTQQLRVLFFVSSTDDSAGFFRCEEQRGGRLKCHLIHSSLINRVTPDSITKAIESLRDAALAQLRITRLTGTQSSFEMGQQHGFWSQQLANSMLYLEENNGET